ncbi:MAG: IucA/IucC family protein [Micromonosporaceae bacterium]
MADTAVAEAATADPHPDGASTQARELVLRDLVDVLVAEDLFLVRQRQHDQPPPELAGVPLAPGERWRRLDLTDRWVAFRAVPAAALQPCRFSQGPVWTGGDGRPVRELAPDQLLATLLAESDELPGGEAAVRDLRAAVAHAAVTLAAPQPRPQGSGLVWGERLAATRDRPFHPTARATVGWTAAERARYGPSRAEPLKLAWVAVRRDRLTLGSGPASDRLHQELLSCAELDQLAAAMRRAAVDLAEYQPLPVHPWQYHQVLPGEFADELAAREVAPVAAGLGRFRPTASIRTLAGEPETTRHLKLPLGVATLGATRLLPPRYLDNGERAQRVMADIAARGSLRGLVALCDESSWSGFGGDPYGDRPGQLCAQLRTYPDGLFDDPDVTVLPMAALAAHEWDLLADVLQVDPVSFFGTLADAFCRLGLGFAGYGTMPELHGQNVVVAIRDGAVERFVLRDHDTLRIYPEWMDAAGVADPAYRIKPGAAQSLRLPSGQALLSYLQTLGFQVNLYGIADAIIRRHGVDERVLWRRLRDAVTAAAEQLDLPPPVADAVRAHLLDAAEWPTRHVFGPLLRRGASSGVSMPAETGATPNPLLSAASLGGADPLAAAGSAGDAARPT